VWLINCRTVIASFSPCIYGRSRLARSSSERIPSSTSDMITAPESHFDAEAILACWSFGQPPNFFQ
jgi:hypothetical protein